MIVVARKAPSFVEDCARRVRSSTAPQLEMLNAHVAIRSEATANCSPIYARRSLALFTFCLHRGFINH